MGQIKIEEENLKSLVRQTVIETLQVFLKDPDFGLELQDWVKKRLRKRSKKFINFDQIKKKYLKTG